MTLLYTNSVHFSLCLLPYTLRILTLYAMFNNRRLFSYQITLLIALLTEASMVDVIINEFYDADYHYVSTMYIP